MPVAIKHVPPTPTRVGGDWRHIVSTFEYLRFRGRDSDVELTVKAVDLMLREEERQLFLMWMSPRGGLRHPSEKAFQQAADLSPYKGKRQTDRWKKLLIHAAELLELDLYAGIGDGYVRLPINEEKTA